MHRGLGFGAICALMLAHGCAKPSSVSIDGSSTVYPITEAVGEEFHKEHPRVQVAAAFSGTTGGFKRFVVGDIDICDASRPISDSERSDCEKNGVEFIELTIAFDGLAVVVNPQNDWCDCLTVEQLKAIWQPESAVHKWSDLNPEWPDQEIELYGADSDSGTFDYFTEMIVGKTGSTRSDYTQSADDNVLVRGVEGDKYSLGYFGLAYFEANQGKLKLLAVDNGDGNCLKPSLETVRDNTYRPLSRPLFIYVRKASLTRPEVRQFVEFYLNQVSDLVTDVGYVPAHQESLQKDKQLFEDTLKSQDPAT